jgi:hypothetical protein
MHFVSDQLFDDRRLRVLVIIENYTRECLALDASARIRGIDVATTLERITAQHGFPKRIKVDNGPEFISKDLDRWAYWNKVELDFSRLGKPSDHALVEAFNSRFRQECLNQHWFMSLEDARAKLVAWQEEYNTERPHSRAIAEHTSNFVDSLTAIWRLSPKPTDYYFAEDVDQVAKVLGFDYWPSEGNAKGPGGFVDSQNRIIYSGGSDEWYPHEFVHIYINPLFPKANGYFLEGYATLMGGSGGHELSCHLKRNYEYLKAHPEIDALTFNGVDLQTPADYFIGGLLCKMAEE